MLKILLSPETRRRMERESGEALRMYRLTNSWLAAAILNCARQAQKSNPEFEPGQCTYDARLIWGIIPEIARRLGVIKMTTNEIDWEIRELSDYDLRIRAGHTLANLGYRRTPGWEMLSREPVHGNPVVYALDRLCPGRLDDAADPIVTRLRELARVRNCSFDGVWTPAFVPEVVVADDEQVTEDSDEVGEAPRA